MKNTKHIISLILMFALAMTILPNFSVRAANTNGKCGENLTWSFDEATGTLIISGSGEMDNWFGWDDRPLWYPYQSEIRAVSLPQGLTSIGSYAFSGCDALTQITFPDNLTSIGLNAFEYCRSLKAVILPDSVTDIGEGAFQGCEKMTSLKISNHLTSISDFAFMFCDSLMSVIIPASVASIGIAAFDNCYSLEEVMIPNSVTSIGAQAFWKCQSLKEITIPDSVVNIGDSVFYGCTGLTSIKVEEGNVNYCSEDGVLFDANKTQLIFCLPNKTGIYQIPNSVTSINDAAFLECAKLTEINMPDSVTGPLKAATFSNCKSLKK